MTLRKFLFIKSFILLISLYPFFDLHSQIIDPTIVAELPFEISEGSGIEFNNNQSIWIHNDSDDLPILYQINKNGDLIRELELLNLNHNDWEDITQDNAGNYYIGDFGNNYSIRDDLVIYKIPNPDSLNSEDFSFEEISFSFQDQNEFPPASEYMNFDCEAMFWLNDTLFIFSKNHGTSTFTRMYKIPAIEGDYNLQVVDSFETGGWITAADISPEQNRVVFLSEDFFWIFYEFDNTNFFDGENKKVLISKTQKEGVVFINNDDIYIVDENYSGPSYLYHINIDSILNPVNNPEIANKILVYPNPVDSSFKINFYHTFHDSYNLFIYKINGEKVFELCNLTGNQLTINIELSAGIYYYHLIGRKENYKGKIVIK